MITHSPTPTSHNRLLQVRSLLVLLLAVLQGGRIFAQHPLYYPINEEDGLPSDEIYEVVQDRFGLIWVASNNGLFSYDGIRIHPFAHLQEKNRAITAVTVDDYDRIWCRNTAGQVFGVVDDSLRLMYDPDAADPVRAIAFDPAGGFCTIVGNKVQHYDGDGRARDSISLLPEISLSSQVLDAAIRKDILFIFVTNLGVFEVDFRTGQKAMRYESDDFVAGGFNFKGADLYLMQIDQRDQSKEILRFKAGKFERIYQTDPLETPERWLRIVPIGGDLWVCTGNGAFPLHSSAQGWTRGSKRFQGTPISSVMVDAEGIEWFSTLTEGFLVVPSPEITRLTIDQGDQKQNNFTSICTLPDGSHLVGSYFGKLFRMDPRASEVQEIFANVGNEGQFQTRRILHAGNQILVSRGVISIIDWPALRLQPDPILQHARDLAIAGEDLFVVSTTIVRKFSFHGTLSLEETLWDTVHLQGGKAVELDRGGKPYFALNDGLFWRPNGSMEEILWDGQKILANLLCAAADGMWAAVPGKGLLWLQQGKMVRALGMQEGIPGQSIRALFATHNDLYFATESHLCALNLETFTITKLSASVGFNPHHINDMTVGEGRLMLATTKGIVSLPLPLKPAGSKAPPIRIQQVTLDNEPVDFQNGLQIQNRNSDLRIAFEGISFRSRNLFHFEYRIAAIDSHWARTPAEANFVNYASLQPGSFDFEVRTVDENGTCSAEPAVLHFEVATPFQQQPVFFILIAVVVLFISFAIFQVRLRYLRRRHRIQEQLIHSQLTALKAQMNPHFMFNALNSIQDFVISKDVRNSNLYLTKFSTLMRKVLDASGQNHVRLSDEIEMLRLYLDLEQLRFGAEMTYTIECAPNVDADGIFIPSMIIQPFVENAIKHGLLHKKGEKLLEMRFAVEGALICTIKDNGVGRKRSAEIKARSSRSHTSFSTAATVKRLDLIRALHETAVNLTITDVETDGEPQGTLVLLTLPIMNPIQPLVK